MGCTSFCGKCGENHSSNLTCIEAARQDQERELDETLQAMNLRYFDMQSFLEFDEQTAAQEAREAREARGEERQFVNREATAINENFRRTGL